jgi:hypothetical protein
MQKVCTEVRIPCSRRLLQTIEGFVKFTHGTREIWIFITWLLSHIHIFFKKIMQECILNIQLPKRTVICNVKGQNKMNCGGLYNRAKCIFIVDDIPLLKPLCYQPCFVSFNSPIRLLLNLEYSTTINDIAGFTPWNKMPHFILYKRTKLLIHGSLPL